MPEDVMKIRMLGNQALLIKKPQQNKTRLIKYFHVIQNFFKEDQNNKKLFIRKKTHTSNIIMSLQNLKQYISVTILHSPPVTCPNILSHTKDSIYDSTL